MASDGVEVPYSAMDDLSAALGKIIAEYENAGTHSSALEEAIGRPLNDSSLQRAASDFESEWDDKRETQRRHLVEMKKRIDDTKAGWVDADKELAASLEAKD